MNRSLCLTLLLLFSWMIAGAHGHDRHKDPWQQHPKMHPYTRAVVGSFGLGAIGGYIAISNTLEYERFFNHTRLLSATLSGTAYFGGHINIGGEYEKDEVWSKNYGGFVAPGIRFHPVGNRHRVDPAIGAAMALGYGCRRDHFTSSFYVERTGNAIERNFFGAMLAELSINFRSTHQKSGIFSLFVTGGYIYSNAKSVIYSTASGYSTFSNNDPGYLQFGIRFGGGW